MSRLISDQAALDIADARLAYARLARAWWWLREATEPGRATRSPGPVASVEQLEMRQAQHRLERHWEWMAVKAGRHPVPHADAASSRPMDARVTVVRDVRGLAETMWYQRTGSVLAWGGRVVDPLSRRITVPCWYCCSTGQAWDTHPGTGTVHFGVCVYCKGHGEKPSGETCRVCFTSGPCDCDMADAYMSAAMIVIRGEMAGRRVSDVAAAAAARVLTRSDRNARRSAGAGDWEQRIDDPCPACRRRDLVAVVAAEGWASSTVECRNRACKCSGVECGCGATTRYEGRRHCWPATEWSPMPAVAKAAA